jgi:hypothetical protein
MCAGTCVGGDFQNNKITLKKMPTGICPSQGSSCAGETTCTPDPACSHCTTANGIIKGNTIKVDPAYLNWRHSLIFSHGSKGWLVEENYLENGTQANAWTDNTQTGLLYLRNTCTWTVRNNYFQANQSVGGQTFVYQQGPGPCPDTGTTNERHIFDNNTFYGRVGIALYHSGACENCEWRNNNFQGYSSGNIGTAIRFSYACPNDDPSSGPYGYNNFFNVTRQSSCDANSAADCRSLCGSPNNETPEGHNLTSNSSFKATGAFPIPFLQLNGTSPLISAGCNRSTTCPNAPAADYDRESRSVPGDVGADEFLSTGTSTPPPEVQNLKRTDKKP